MARVITPLKIGRVAENRRPLTHRKHFGECVITVYGVITNTR